MKKRVILYVEDNLSLAKKNAENFETNGFLVARASDGQEAIRLFNEYLPDIAILEIKLKNYMKDGFWIAKQIRKYNKHIPILFLTSMEDEETAVKAFEVGAFDFIRKRVGDKELVVRINHALIHCHHKDYTPNQKLIITSDTHIDLTNNTLVSFGHPENLKQTECELLQFLFSHKNYPQNREFIMNLIWKNVFNDRQYMKKAVCQLRKLLSRDKKISLIAKRNVSITLLVMKY